MEIKCSANLLDIRIDMISQIRLYEMVILAHDQDFTW